MASEPVELNLSFSRGKSYHERLDVFPSDAVLEKKNDMLLLNLDYNNIENLPDDIGEMTHIVGLSMNHNELGSLPESFGNLQNLTELKINNNKLSSLPESFRSLVNLRVLHLENNLFRKIPDVIRKLKNLEFLEFKGNPVAKRELFKLTELLKNNENLVARVTVVDKNGRQSNIKLNHQNRAELEKIRNEAIKKREEKRTSNQMTRQEIFPGTVTKSIRNYLGFQGGKGRRRGNKTQASNKRVRKAKTVSKMSAKRRTMKNKGKKGKKGKKRM